MLASEHLLSGSVVALPVAVTSALPTDLISSDGRGEPEKEGWPRDLGP